MQRILTLLLTVAATGATVGGAQRPAPDAPADTGLIIGQVVDAQSGEGVGGILVYVTPTISGPRRVLIADSKGRFYFPGLPPGRFSIGTTGLSDTSASRSATALGQVIDVGDGEVVSGVRVGVLRYASATGTVVDDAGDPVVGAGVVAFRAVFRRSGLGYDVAGTAQTDDRGVFQHARLRPGDYLFCACDYGPLPLDAGVMATLGAEPTNLLAAEERGLRMGVNAVERDSSFRTYTKAFHPVGSSVELAAPVTLASGEDRQGVNIQTTAVPSLALSGRVTGMTGPLSSGSVRLGPVDQLSGLVLGSVVPTEVQPDGRFRFWGVAPGDYLLTVRHRPSTGTGTLDGAALAVLGARGQALKRAATSKPVALGGQEVAEIQVSIGNRDLTNLEVPIQGSVSLKGRVVFAGGTPQPTAAELTRVSIALEALSASTNSPLRTARSSLSESGTFALPGVPPGPYGVSITTTAEFRTVSSVTVEGRDVTDQALEVGPEGLGEIVVTLSDTPLTTLSGHAAVQHDPDGRAMMVVSFPKDPRYWPSAGAARRRFRDASIDQKGGFEITGLPPDEYYLALVENRIDMIWQTPDRLNELARTATTVTVLPGANPRVEIRR